MLPRVQSAEGWFHGVPAGARLNRVFFRARAEFHWRFGSPWSLPGANFPFLSAPFSKTVKQGSLYHVSASRNAQKALRHRGR